MYYIDYKDLGKQAGVDILEVFYLPAHAFNMNMLYDKLQKYRDYSFKSNERLLFLDVDTDFLFCGIPITLYNLHQVIRKTFLPTFACIIAGSNDVTDFLKQMSEEVTLDVPIKYVPFDGYLDCVPITKEKIEPNFDAVIKQYTFLSNNNRSHRQVMFNWLKDNNLLDKGLVNYKHLSQNKEDESIVDLTSKETIQLVYPEPRGTVNDSWVIKDEYIRSLSSNPNYDYKNFDEDTFVLHDLNRISHSPVIQKAFCYISNETVFSYKYNYISEKSYKMFSSLRPMISFGPPRILKKLHEQEFKTWSNYWDEDYDNIEDPTQRFIAITALIKEISTFSLEKCKLLLEDMTDILVHNQNVYVDSYVINQKRKFIECLKSKH